MITRARAEGAGPSCPILDEESRSLLFEVINARYLKGSIITTSHVGIASWAERLGDPMLAAAPAARRRDPQGRHRRRDSPVSPEQRTAPPAAPRSPGRRRRRGRSTAAPGASTAGTAPTASPAAGGAARPRPG